ncbi:APC family permease [Spiroplasma culicicola]|uniref:Amino acid permease n=1 Tax=Spiroplasma culicicola AES-1 TaxID=1276246 RepID=W6A8P0_9MOLU|nr:APC family permease [Spiroplasma culicicola]AHI53387.1 amino acid permease [Spiroplasma culicicola AES-1]
MIKVNKKNKAMNKTFEFLTIFSLTFGIVVGSGIYLKNSSKDGVLAAAGQNPWVAIAVWVFVGVFACMMMLSFIEASSISKKDEHNTMPTIGATFLGRRFGTIFSIFYIVIYWPVLTIIGGLFTVNALFSAVDAFVFATSNEAHTLNDLMGGETVRITVELILGSVILLGFQLFNTFYTKEGKWVQIILSVLKFVPLLMVLIGGFTLFFSGKISENSFETDYEPFKVNHIFMALIPILFAFDGFVDSIAIQKDIEHKEVVAPAMLTGIIAVSIFYLIITISIFVASDDGNVLSMFDNVSPQLSLVFNLIIVVTLLATVNAYTALFPRMIQGSIDEGYIYSKDNSKKLDYKKACLMSGIITMTMAVIFVTISLLITDKGSLDYFLVSYYSADTGILFVFIIYGLIMAGLLDNRRTKKYQTKQFKGSYAIGIITLLILVFMVSYMHYVSIVQNIVDFIKFGGADKLIIPSMWFGFLTIIISTWLVNDFLLKNKEVNKIDKSK